jgi:predicted ATPase
LFKHALVRDAAYSTLLREPRRALHACIAETLENQFAEIAENQPELLARHCTEAGLIKKAASLWGKAGQRSLEHAALVEAVEQLSRALDQIATLPTNATLRREQIKLQVALITPLMHVKGHAALETRAAAEQARLLVEQAEKLNEPLEDPLLLFSLLYGLWIANYVAFNGEVLRAFAAEFQMLAERQSMTAPLLISHRILGITAFFVGKISLCEAQFDQALALYAPAEHRLLTARFGPNSRVNVLSYRSMVRWTLGYPEAALRDADQSLREAREIDHALTLIPAPFFSSITNMWCGNYDVAKTSIEEAGTLAEGKGAAWWKNGATVQEGILFGLTNQASTAINVIVSVLGKSTSGTTVFGPWLRTSLARAHADLGQIGDACRCMGEAAATMERTGERWYEAEVHRATGEIALLGAERGEAKAQAQAQAYFERALTVARQQQAKSWELRAATNLARLWRDQGKVQQAHELLAQVYGWFTEGFDTRDLKEAKVLLEELAA